MVTPNEATPPYLGANFELTRRTTILATTALLASGVVMGAQGASAAGTGDQHCANGIFPSGWFDGTTPAAGSPLGMYVRQTPQGFFAYVTGPKAAGRHTYGLKVVSPKRLDGQYYGTQSDDSGVITNHNPTLTMTFHNSGEVEGVAFQSPCAAQLAFTFTLDGKPMSPSHIYLGKTRVHPSSSQFTIYRR